MKFGINTCLWTASPTLKSLPGLLQSVRAAGGDWIELPLYADVDELRPAAVRPLLRDHAMGVSVVTGLLPGESLTTADADAADRGVASLMKVIETAAEIGATRVSGAFHTTGERPLWQSPPERAERIDRLCECLARVAVFAAQQGVTVCIEPINRYEADLLNTTAQALDVVSRVAHPSCGLLLDTFHMNIEDPSVGAALRSAGRFIGHIHANESHRGAAGSGHIDWPDVAAALHEIGYQGALVIEAFDPALAAVAQGGHAWHAHADSAEALAASAIAFLRQAMSR